MISQRNRDIFCARLSGKTFKAIGEEFDLSPERVRQIIFKQERMFLGFPRIIAAQKETIKSLQEQIDGLCDLLASDVPPAEKNRQSGDVWRLELSVRTANCLNNMGVSYINDLSYLPESWLLSFPNFGRKSLNELREVARIHGVILGSLADNRLIDGCRDWKARDLGIKSYLHIIKEQSAKAA